MSNKVFIASSHSEAKELRNRVLDSLGDDAVCYYGVSSDSPELTDHLTNIIRSDIKGLICDTDVTVVIISPNMRENKWIDWEIEQSLLEYKHDNKMSKTSGIVGVVQKVDGDYSWLQDIIKLNDWGKLISAISYDKKQLSDIINDNRQNNKNPDERNIGSATEPNVSYNVDMDYRYGSYMTLVEEDIFLNDIHKCIENAYEKSQKRNEYKLSTDN